MNRESDNPVESASLPPEDAPLGGAGPAEKLTATASGGFQEFNLRSTRIRDMGLQIAGTRLEPIIRAFEAELDAVGLHKLRPRFYLSTEWGVAFGTIAIALPFYLAKPELQALQAEHVGHIE